MTLVRLEYRLHLKAFERRLAERDHRLHETICGQMAWFAIYFSAFYIH